MFDKPDAGPQDAGAWVRERAADLALRAGKPVVVKETGFPHGGKEAYTAGTQNAFCLHCLKPGILSRQSADAPAWVFRGVAFEAFDLPWKSEESKLGIERHWGLLCAQRAAYPALAAWNAVRESRSAKPR